LFAKLLKLNTQELKFLSKEEILKSILFEVYVVFAGDTIATGREFALVKLTFWLEFESPKDEKHLNLAL
jgi:hypothetical protein